MQSHNIHDLYLNTTKDLPPILRWMDKVNGGYIGEKLPKDSSNQVWETLKRAGFKQMIDLRFGHIPQQFIERCEEYGMSYFHYPIHNDPETIASMVENFPKLDELLRTKRFYIQGRHTSYVMLYIYEKLTKRSVLDSYDMLKIGRDAQLRKRINPLLKAMSERMGITVTDDKQNSLAEELKALASQERDNYPESTTFYSIINFKKGFRNETTVYDISMEEFGTIGYLYAPREKYGPWEYDIIMRPSESGMAYNFRDAQVRIAKHLSYALRFSYRWAKLSDAVKKQVLLFDQL